MYYNKRPEIMENKDFEITEFETVYKYSKSFDIYTSKTTQSI